MSNQEHSWFIASPQGNKGPFSQSQMLDMLGNGAVDINSFVWREGLSNWMRIVDCDDFVGAAKPGAAKPAAAAAKAQAADPAAAPKPAAAAVPNAQNQDDYMDGIFVDLVKDSWRRYGNKLRAREVDEVLVGAVITATLDNGYSLIDLHSTGTDHFLRFEDIDTGNRIIFQLRHLAESYLTSQVIGHEASVTIGYGERFKNFNSIWKALRQEAKGGYVKKADPGIITVDGDLSSQYVYVEVGLFWDINEYLKPDNPYEVIYPKLTEHVGASIHALRKYLRGRFGAN